MLLATACSSNGKEDKQPLFENKATCYEIGYKYHQEFKKAAIEQDPTVVEISWKSYYSRNLNTCVNLVTKKYVHNNQLTHRYLLDTLNDKLLYMMVYGTNGHLLEGASNFKSDDEFDKKVDEITNRNTQ